MADDGQSNTIFDFPRTIPSEGTATPAEIVRAFAEIFGESAEDLHLFATKHAMKLTRYNRADAEDLVQDAFVRVLKHTFDRPVDGRAYLSRIVTNLYIDWYRRRKQQEEKLGVKTGYEVALNGGSSEHVSRDLAEGVVFSAEIRGRIEVAINSYPDEEQRLCLWARFDLDNGELRELKEVAAITGFHLSKVKRHCQPILPLMREMLADLVSPATESDAPTI